MKRSLLVFLTIVTTLTVAVGPTVPPAWAQPSTDVSPSATFADEAGSWPMAGANPQRTSWTPEQVPTAEYLAAHRNEWDNGKLYPQWFKPLESYVPHKVQVIAANGLLYISTSRGLYALYAVDPDGTGPMTEGDLAWTYPTEMPLGHSPSVAGDTLYVGGFDHKLHALAANPSVSSLPTKVDAGGNAVKVNNQVRWTFEAGAGFDTNPLVINNTVYAGNRDGVFYAVDAASGALRWKFQTQGPIHFSAATNQAGSVVYFASDDSFAYALNAQTGSLVWKSAKLPGAGFHSYWPVVYTDPQSQKDYVLMGGSHNYRDNVSPGEATQHTNLDGLDRELFQGQGKYGATGGTCGALIGQRRADGLMDAGVKDSRAPASVSDYYRSKPWRRTVFVFDAASGQEADFNNDRQPDYAPFTWLGSQSGNRFPSVIRPDGTVYQTAGYLYRNYISGAGVLGWKPGTTLVSTPGTYLQVVDEPVYIAGGGNIIYWSVHSDLDAGGLDTSVPNGRLWDNAFDANCQATNQPSRDNSREWTYWDYDLDRQMPGYDVAEGGWDFGGGNGTYGRNGDGNPPIPYRGKVFVIKGNAVLAFGPQQTQVRALPMAREVQVGDWAPAVSEAWLVARLKDEVQKMISAGHLRPGYYSSGHVDAQAAYGGYVDPSSGIIYGCGDSFQDYFSNPADTINVLSRVLSLSQIQADSAFAQQVKDYLLSELESYPPYGVTHIGWASGASREAFDLPPEAEAERSSFGPTIWKSYAFEGWGGQYGGNNYPPHLFYALWKFALAQGYTQAQARALFDRSKGSLNTHIPSNDVFIRHPFVVNSFIVGYQGYLELEKMAGYPASTGVSDSLASLRTLRATTFSKDTYYSNQAYPPQIDIYCRAFNSSQNFMFLTPELGQFLHDNALAKVQEALVEYSHNTPYWFVERYEDTINEGMYAPLYDTWLFQARAYILKEPREELVKYLDVPAFVRGDLFYIQNLVAAIEAPAQGATPTFADVPFSHPFHDVIEALYQAGYTAGCSTNPLMYCPDQTMNRAESAVFVERGIHAATYDPPVPGSQVFADLGLDSWAAKWVNGLWVDQYTAGCGTNPLVYCPWQGHTRAEGCVFYLRMLRGANYEPPQPSQQTFVDVPLTAWYAKWVQAAYDAALLTPCQTTPESRFCPDDPLTRALAAYMMVHAKGLGSP